MSLPLSPKGAVVQIEVSASQAAMLAHSINYLLSRIQDHQESDPECMLNVKPHSDLWFLLEHAQLLHVCEGVELIVLPDSPTPGSSGYENFSQPYVYIPE